MNTKTNKTKKIKDLLKSFYNYNAKKYRETRKKYWPDGNLILDYIKKYIKSNKTKQIKILELGCGSGRLISLLNSEINDNTKNNIKYTGVDFSQELIDFAQKDNPKNHFICDDMVNYITKLDQEDFDIVIFTSSFQHISNPKERLFVFKNIYRILKYDGLLIMTNWSLSRWLIKKHKIPFLKSILKFIFSLGSSSYRDLYIPWYSIEQKKKYFRYYHFFSLKEIHKLCKLSGFIEDKLIYLNRTSHEVDTSKNANNSFLVAVKQNFIQKNDF